jgi:ABC-type transport system substrate-binding protein
MPLAAMSHGLLDVNLRSEPVPGIATEWEATTDLLTYTCKLRQGVLFHNGRAVDAAAVKWNFARLKHPQTSRAFARTALKNLQDVVVLDQYTVRCHLYQPRAAFPANLRIGEVDLVDTMSYTDAASFAKRYAGKLQTWDVSTLGTSFLIFNLDKGPFTDKRLWQAAAHATDYNAIHDAVFYGRGKLPKGFMLRPAPGMLRRHSHGRHMIRIKPGLCCDRPKLWGLKCSCRLKMPIPI